MDAAGAAAKSSVRNLGALYSVVVALALENAIVKLIPATESAPINWSLVPLLVALLATLIPFYHGALRHLDLTYVEHPREGLKNGALLADFLLLFIEGSLFVALARLLDSQDWFARSLVTLLLLDAVWGIAAYFAFSRHLPFRAQAKWAGLNLGTVVVLVPLILMTRGDQSPLLFGSSALAIGVMIVAIVRTSVDYWISWPFYTGKVPPGPVPDSAGDAVMASSLKLPSGLDGPAALVGFLDERVSQLGKRILSVRRGSALEWEGKLFFRDGSGSPRVGGPYQTLGELLRDVGHRRHDQWADAPDRRMIWDVLEWGGAYFTVHTDRLNSPTRHASLEEAIAAGHAALIS